MTDSGIVYCVPYSSYHHDNLTIPGRGGANMWISCAAALDGCIYCMPYCAHCIMTLDPKKNDAISSVGDDLGDGEYKYNGTIVDIDG